jgi:DNA-binding MarR family transcriptional regulator
VTEDETAARLRSVIGRMGRGLRQAHARSELSPSQYEVLATVSVRERVRLADLGALEGLNPTLLSRIVGRLEDAELVRREQDAGDRRIAHVAITEQGRALHLRIRAERTGVLAGAITALSPADQETLRGALPVLESLATTVREAGR